MTMAKLPINLGKILFLALVIGLVMTQGTPAAISDGLVGYWPFDEGLGGGTADLISGYNGKLGGNTVWIDSALSGLPGYALRFAGGSSEMGDHVQINEIFDGQDIPAVLMPTTAVSVSAWARCDDFAASQYGAVFFCSHYTSDITAGYCLYTHPSGWRWKVATASGTHYNDYAANTDQWYHLVLTYDGAYVRFYVDGQEQQNAPATGDIDWDPIPLNCLVGRYNDDNEDFAFLGDVDDVAVWNRALTPSEVQYLYNNGNARAPYTPIISVIPLSVNVSEGGTTDNYAIVLLQEPDQSTVFVTATTDNLGQVKINDANQVILTFTTSNWDVLQSITVAAVPDEEIEGTHSAYIRHLAASDDPAFNDVLISNVTAAISDADLIKIPVGPYVHFSQRGQVTVYWKTETAVPSILRYKIKNGDTQQIEHASAKTEHQLTITGLKPETVYLYNILINDGQTTKSTDLFEFYTAFDAEPGAFPTGTSPYPVDSMTALYEQAAQRILEQADLNKGVCIDYGCGQGRLAYEIAKRSDLRILAFEPNSQNVAQAREFLDQAGIYGKRITVLERDLSTLDFRDYAANLIVSDNMIAQGNCPGTAAEMFRVLRPAGGQAYLGQPLGCPTSLSQTELENWLDTAGLDYTTSQDPNGLWAKLEREPISGSGEWTHFYANPQNTAASTEQNIQNSMKLLWYGQPGPRYIIDRHNRPMSSLYKNGLIVTPGIDGIGEGITWNPPDTSAGRIMAFDAYNGTRYWDVLVPNAARTAIVRDCGWVVLTDDYVYVANEGNCVGLDVKTGEPIVHLQEPNLIPDETRHWGYLAVDGDIIFGTGQKEGASLISHCNAHRWESYRDNMPIATGDYLFAMDRHSGNLLWTYKNISGSVIISPAITIGGDYIYFIESRNPDAISDDLGRVPANVLLAGSYAYLVKVNKNTGSVAQTVPISLPFTNIIFLSYAAADNLVIATGSNRYANIVYEHRAYNSSNLSLSWSSNYDAGRPQVPAYDNHGEQDQHPCIIGHMLYSRYYKVELDNNGNTTAFLLSRGNCGTQSGCDTHLFGRNGNPCMFELPGTSASAVTNDSRPGCWINMIPAGGMLLVPESSSGCTCDYEIQSSMAFVPD
ncbi:MAG: methyltransferase domain-containing protein [Sedimentisphaerales bacterium]|nr:methyltransferase domain-containing protein [Sedimentisphaerales bacterium]